MLLDRVARIFTALYAPFMFPCTLEEDTVFYLAQSSCLELGMLAVSPLREERGDETCRGEDCFSIAGGVDDELFLDFSDAGDLLDSIDFDDVFAGDYALPDLEIEGAEASAEFSTGSEVNPSTTQDGGGPEKELSEVEEMSAAGSSSSGEEGSEKKSGGRSGGKRKEEGDRGGRRRSSAAAAAAAAQGKTNPQAQGKRKIKVDWTPDLHRRFVQAVEQLGVDKAVPSRILEIMGVVSLTRHNIASHLQKYRSQRRHLLSLEADAAGWSKRRQIYGAAVGGSKRVMTPWAAPAMGFPPVAPSVHHFRPLHVWGHPTMASSREHGAWPKHPFHSQPLHVPPSVPTWAVPSSPLQHLPPPTPPPPPPPDPSYWHQQGFGFALVPGIPHHQGMYKVDPGIGVPTPAGQVASSQPWFDYERRENVDAAIEEVLSKPWQGLPLGLKPPSLDGVLRELQRQGIPSIPPTSSS
ncbi:hypothetical protein BT93_K1864 [Corymbia citriodora subsp. variegata]|nr:hypothetical protein BT93_K1864 [Corymbia citriodora subsp. variegata]